MSVENSSSKVVDPKFGFHAIDFGLLGISYDKKADLLEDKGIFDPNSTGIWKNRTRRRVNRIKPAIIGFDSLYANDEQEPNKFDYNSLFRQIGDPFSYKSRDNSPFIVAGDVTTNSMVNLKFEDWNRTLSDAIEKGTEENLFEKFRTFANLQSVLMQTVPLSMSGVFSLMNDMPYQGLAAAACYYPLGITLLDGFIASRESLRPVKKAISTLELFRIPRVHMMRNALLPAKIVDARERLGDNVQEGPSVVVFGLTHGIGKQIDVWNDPGKREKVLTDYFMRIFKHYSKVNEQATEEDFTNISKALSYGYARTTVWEMTGKPQSNSREEAKEYLKVADNFESKGVRDAISSAAEKVIYTKK